ncbi:MAG: hypothetical protein KGZ85_07855 [Ignavibacterium sp.]|nr:hypothetical protein [Ignavibacterium sp.]
MSTQLVKLTEERIGNNNQLQKFVQQARTIANVVFPETLPFSDKYCRLGAEIVTVNPNDDKQVYQNESGGYCLHLSKLNEIAKAAKIRVVGSRILERKVDETGRVTFISHEVTVQYRTVSGEMIKESYTGKYDYFNDAATKSEKQTKSRRKHAEALAESNALTRAFNKVLPQLPQSFNKKDFDKPFLIPYVEEDKNALLSEFSPEEQKSIKKELARQKLGIVDTIYQSGSPANNSRQVEEAVVTEEVTEAPKTETPPNEDPGFISETYREAPQNERTEKILQLIELKKFQDPKGTPFTQARIEQSPLDSQIKFIKKLLEMPDAEEALPI